MADAGADERSSLLTSRNASGRTGDATGDGGGQSHGAPARPCHGTYRASSSGCPTRASLVDKRGGRRSRPRQRQRAMAPRAVADAVHHGATDVRRPASGKGAQWLASARCPNFAGPMLGSGCIDLYRRAEPAFPRYGACYGLRSSWRRSRGRCCSVSTSLRALQCIRLEDWTLQGRWGKMGLIQT